MPSVFDLVAILLVLTALFGWLNHVLIRLPHTIGLLLMGLAASLLLIGVELALPQATVYESLARLLRRIDFQSAVLDSMLAFLLFAGALNVDFSILRRRALVVGLMATLGVLISTGVVALGLWWVSALLGIGIPFSWALVFGALISPTDPVAVLSVLKSVNVPETAFVSRCSILLQRSVQQPATQFELCGTMAAHFADCERPFHAMVSNDFRRS